MTTEYLREFLTLAEMGNYSDAAEPLFISEGTLSRHIMALEKELGAALFRRLPRRIELTEVGIAFMPYARQIVAAEDACLTSVSHRVDADKSALSIGFDRALAYYGVPALLAGFVRKNPEFVFRVTEGESFALKEQVTDGILHLAFILDDGTGRGASPDCMEYRRDAMVVAFHDRHSFAAQESLHMSKLSGENLLLPPPFTAMYELCARTFRRTGFEPASTVTADFSGPAAEELTRRGMCIAVLPEGIARTWEHRGGICVREVLPRSEIAVSLIFDPDSLPDAGQLFLNDTEEAADK